MNEWCIYIALFVYCCTPKALYNHVGVSPQPPPPIYHIFPCGNTRAGSRLLLPVSTNRVTLVPKPGKEAGTGEHLTHFNNKINKHKWKAAAPHGRLPHTKHKLKFQAWSSLVFHCHHSSFNPSEAPPWDSRPVSGAGVVHYQLLHRPRSVPTALGPAPLATPSLFHYFKIVNIINVLTNQCILDE